MGYREQFAQALQQYGVKKDPIQEQYEAQLLKQSQPNEFKGAIQTVDALTGTNFTGQLPKEQTQKEKLAELLSMRQGQEQQKLKGLGQLANMESDQEAKAAQRAFQEKLYGLQLLKAKSKIAGNGGGRKLGSEDIKSINNIDSMMADIPKLKAALQRGEKILPEVMGVQIGGDNEASAARKRIKEWFGRNQSGGAIGNQEAKDFYEIISSVTDSDEMKMKKLDGLFNDVKRRRDAFYYGPTAQPNVSAGGMAGPSPASNMNYDDMSDAELEALLGMR